MNWIVKSNRYFDTWGDFKLLALFAIIILAGSLDAFVFKTTGWGYVITLAPFTVWRMLGLWISEKMKKDEKEID